MSAQTTFRSAPAEPRGYGSDQLCRVWAPGVRSRSGLPQMWLPNQWRRAIRTASAARRSTWTPAPHAPRPAVHTIEQTGKSWKAGMLVFGGLFLLGIVIAASGNGPAGGGIATLGAVGYVVVKIG